MSARRYWEGEGGGGGLLAWRAGGRGAGEARRQPPCGPVQGRPYEPTTDAADRWSAPWQRGAPPSPHHPGRACALWQARPPPSTERPPMHTPYALDRRSVRCGCSPPHLRGCRAAASRSIVSGSLPLGTQWLVATPLAATIAVGHLLVTTHPIVGLSPAQPLARLSAGNAAGGGRRGRGASRGAPAARPHAYRRRAAAGHGGDHPPAAAAAAATRNALAPDARGWRRGRRRHRPPGQSGGGYGGVPPCARGSWAGPRRGRYPRQWRWRPSALRAYRRVRPGAPRRWGRRRA